MLVLFETAAGYAIFKMLDEKKLKEVENLYKEFETPERASKIVKLLNFHPFADITDALSATSSLVEGRVSKSLKKTLRKEIIGQTEKLLVADPKLGCAIKEKLDINCVANTSVIELFRCIKGQADSLIPDLSKEDMHAMTLGLAHSMARYKLKFSPDKIDVMIVQGISILEELDKEINNLTMRAREWYGWHFPELGREVVDNDQYIKAVMLIGKRSNAKSVDLSDILQPELEERVKELSEMSVGTDVCKADMEHVLKLCREVTRLTLYRASLMNYIQSRMMALAPNVSILVGELVAAKLIAKAGSLMNLAKYPASTIQILGAEKALFRALKTKRETPKYGILFNTSLVGAAAAAVKGKMARMLAAKFALAARLDAFCEETCTSLGPEHKVKLEIRLRELEETSIRRVSGTAKAKAKFQKYYGKPEALLYPVSSDSTIKGLKRKTEAKEEPGHEEETITEPPKKKKKVPEVESLEAAEELAFEGAEQGTEEGEEGQGTSEVTGKRKKKKKKTSLQKDVQVKEEPEEEAQQPEKKKKKKKKEYDIEDID